MELVQLEHLCYACFSKIEVPCVSDGQSAPDFVVARRRSRWFTMPLNAVQGLQDFVPKGLRAQKPSSVGSYKDPDPWVTAAWVLVLWAFYIGKHALWKTSSFQVVGSMLKAFRNVFLHCSPASSFFSNGCWLCSMRKAFPLRTCVALGVCFNQPETSS